MVSILSQHCITVRDLDRAIEFGNGVCGIPVVSRTDIAQAKEAVPQSPHGGEAMAAGCESVMAPQRLDRWPVQVAFVKDFT